MGRHLLLDTVQPNIVNRSNLSAIDRLVRHKAAPFQRSYENMTSCSAPVVCWDHRKGGGYYWNFRLYSVNSNSFCMDVCKHYLALVGGSDHYIQTRRPALTTQLRILHWRQKYRPLASNMLTHQPFTLTLSGNHVQSSVWTWLLILQYLLEACSPGYSDSWACLKITASSSV